MNIDPNIVKQILLWVLIVGLMGLMLIILFKKQNSLKSELLISKNAGAILDREHAVIIERLAGVEIERERDQADFEKMLASRFLEQEHLTTKYEQLGVEHSELRSEMSSVITKAQQIDPLIIERDNALHKLELLRNEKSLVDAEYAALQAQVEEERKAAEAQRQLRQINDLEVSQEKQRRIEEVLLERDDARAQLEILRKSYGKLETDLASIQSKLEEERKSAIEKIRLLEQAELRLTKEFENLANRIFEEKHIKFNEVSKKSVENLLNPIQQQLTDFRKKVEDVYDNENKERASLRTEITLLKSLNERIGTDALNLTKALKGDSKIRGNWGEMQLERLLEDSGLTKGREYDVQVSMRNDDGQRFQPDVVIHLPESKDVVIDSKVSLVGYEKFHSAENEEQRVRFLRSHIGSIRTHLTSLSSKNYSELIGVSSLDLVIMFVPIEPALLLAFEHEPNLFSEAFNRRILLVSPSTLMATLQIIHNIWRYEYQNLNAQTIASEAGKLYDHFVLFVEALEKVGEQLGKATDSYSTAHKRLISGRGNLIGRTQILKKLGAKTKKSISNDLLTVAIENISVDGNFEQISQETIA